MTPSQTEVKELCRKIYPGGDNHFAQPVKGGKWRIGYTNDYPMQHGSGEEVVLPEQVVKMLLSNPESTADSIPDQDADKDRFAIAFSCWAMFDPQAKAYRDAGISAAGLLDKYKSRPYIDNDTSKQ